MFFETSFRVEKDKKQRNTSFGNKKGLDLKTGIIFESFGCQVFGNAVIHYHTKSILKDLAQKIIEVYFSLTFYIRNPKNKKIPFLVTKSGQNYFIDGRPPNRVAFYFSVMIFGQIFFMVRSHGFDGLFAAFDVT